MSDRSLRIQAEAARVLLENMRDVIGDDDELKITTIEGETGFLDAVDATTFRIQQLSAMAKALKAYKAEIDVRADRLDAQHERLRTMLAAALEQAEIKRLERPLATLSMSTAKTKLLVTEEADIPAQFWKPGDPKLDRTALTKALDAGTTVPGATLTNGGQTLTIRGK